MTVYELQQKILKLKKEKDVAVLAHSYVAKEITEIADVVGDSFALSRKATDIDSKNIILWRAFYGGNRKNAESRKEGFPCQRAGRLSYGRTVSPRGNRIL